ASKDRLPGARPRSGDLRDHCDVSDRDPVRLFLALWPDAPLGARLAAYRDAWRWPAGTKPVTDATLHLTLPFIGALARHGLPPLAWRATSFGPGQAVPGRAARYEVLSRFGAARQARSERDSG